MAARHIVSILTVALLFQFAGCDRPPPPPPPPNSAPALPAVAPVVPDSPKYGPVAVMTGVEGDSCTVTFTPLPIVRGREIRHGSECGHAGSITKLSWRYLGTTDAGDRYEFERTFPADGEVSTTIKKEVVYAGRDLLVFDHETAPVHMRPPTAAEQPPEAE